jgi:hypothetical protein
MKINKEIRKKAIKRMIARYEKLQSEVNPYGFDADNGMKYYYLLDYWEDRLNESQHLITNTKQR